MSFLDRARRATLGGVLVLGIAGVGLGVWLRSEPIAAAGLLLTLLQTAVALVDLVGSHRERHERRGRPGPRRPSPPPLAEGDDQRRELARRLLATHRTEELTPSLPGGATIDLDYVAEAELVTFRSQGDAVAGFGDLVETVEAEGGPLVLVGAPGSGKSLTARRLVTALLERGTLAERFLLWRWDGEPLADWLAAEWARGDHGLDVADAARLVADPAVVLVLDGLDEVARSRRESCVNAINDMVELRPSARLVICCRSREYRALAERIDSRRVRRISKLTPATVAEFVDLHGPTSWGRVRAALPEDVALRSLLSTPLFLIAALRAFRDDPSPLLAGTLPERQHVLWDVYIARMLMAGCGHGEPLHVRRRRLEDVALTMAASGTFELVREPEPLQAFMDHCVDRHLLRRSASGYQCMHRQLLGHLVARAAVDGSGTTTPDLLDRLLTPPTAASPLAWNNLAREALAAGHPDVATQLSGRALALEPADSTLLGDHAFHLLAAGRPDEAVEHAEAAEAGDPTDWGPPSTLAYALFALGDLDGSVVARARAWANGNRLSDPSFLAYLLALRGLRDETGTVLDQIRATDGDDARRLDRALALAALGRAGEAADSLFPLRIEEFDEALLLFDVPVEAARPLVPDGAFDLHERKPGVARLALVANDHRKNPWGPYHEIVCGLLVRPAGTQPTARAPGAYLVHRSVNERIGYGAVHVTVDLAHAIADIHVEYTDDEVTFDVRTDGHTTLHLGLPRIRCADEPKAIETTSFSLVGDMPYAVPERYELPPGVVPDLNQVRIDLGTGPLAELLRSLGLPTTPTFCAWGENLSMTRHLPQPVRTESPRHPAT